MDKPKNLLMRKRMVMGVGAMLLIVGALVVFMGLNYNRIENQNLQYLEGNTQQTQLRVDNMMSNAIYDIQLLAKVYSDTNTSPAVNGTDLETFIDSTSFDQLALAVATGMAVNNNSQTVDVSGDSYFKDGMAGNTGFVPYTLHTAAGAEQGLLFYSPVKYKGEIVGVISGYYDQGTLREFLTAYYFGEQTTTYLCDRDGDILACSNVFAQKDTSVFDIYEKDGDTTVDGMAKLQNALNHNVATNFTYVSSGGTGLAYAMPLENFNLFVVDTFPASITNGMVGRANGTAGFFVGFILVVFALFVVYLLWDARQRNSQLLLENRRASRIIDASTNLFRRFVLLNLTENRYEYLKNDGVRGELLPQGSLDDLRRYWREAAVDKESHQALASVLNPEIIQRDLTADVPFLQSEYRVFKEHAPGGEIHWLQSAALCLERDDNGVPTQVMLAVQDVTDIKSEERRTREAVEEAYHAAANASEAKSNFLNAMSHDIRTPMNSIMGLTSIALMNIHDSERVRDCLSKITTASQHLLRLINEVLDMAKIESGTIVLQEEDFNLAEMMENLMETVMPQASVKGQLVTFDATNITHEYVSGDVIRLQQVIGNVLNNAVKFTPNGGTIKLHITEKPSHLEQFGCYQFTVTDTGCGMSEEFIHHIFEPFTRVHDSRTTKVVGTGLGMPIAKTIVDMMNGSIEVTSEEGVGSTFVVTVFLRLSDSSDAYLKDLGGARVLVADDDDVARENMEAMLREFGVNPVCVCCGEDAVYEMKKAQREGWPFRAALLDWRMPTMSGLETAIELKNLTSDDFPIAIVSGFDLTAVEDEASKAGIKAFITKPVFRTRLSHGLRELLTGAEEPEIVDEAELLRRCDCTGKRILLAEDNDLAAAIAIEVIGRTGAEVLRAENGERAVEMLLAEEPGYFDMVFTDIQMPIMNGYEEAKTIRAHGRGERPDLAEIPIVALTADAFSDDKRNAELAGMNGHMSKPLSIPVLVKMLNTWL